MSSGWQQRPLNAVQIRAIEIECDGPVFSSTRLWSITLFRMQHVPMCTPILRSDGYPDLLRHALWSGTLPEVACLGNHLLQ